MERVREIEERLAKVEREIKEIIDLIIEARQQSGENKKATKDILERHLIEMSKYLKDRSKASGGSLSGGVNLWKLL